MFESVNKLYRKYRFKLYQYRLKNKLRKFYRNNVKVIKCKMLGHNFVDSSYWSGHSETCYYCGLKHMIRRSTTIRADGTIDEHLDQNDKYYFT